LIFFAFAHFSARIGFEGAPGPFHTKFIELENPRGAFRSPPGKVDHLVRKWDSNHCFPHCPGASPGIMTKVFRAVRAVSSFNANSLASLRALTDCGSFWGPPNRFSGLCWSVLGTHGGGPGAKSRPPALQLGSQGFARLLANVLMGFFVREKGFAYCSELVGRRTFFLATLPHVSRF